MENEDNIKQTSADETVQFGDDQTKDISEASVTEESKQQETNINKEYISKAEFEQSINDLKSTFERGIQGLRDSTVDRVANRINDKLQTIDEKFNALKLQGVPVDESIIQSAKNKVIQEEMINDTSIDNKPNNTQTTTEPNIDETDLVNFKAFKKFQEYGFSINKGDPEVESIDMNTPDGYLSSLDKALQAKKARLEQEDINKSRNQMPGFSSSGNSGNTIRTINDPMELINEGLKDM